MAGIEEIRIVRSCLKHLHSLNLEKAYLILCSIPKVTGITLKPTVCVKASLN